MLIYDGELRTRHAEDYAMPRRRDAALSMPCHACAMDGDSERYADATLRHATLRQHLHSRHSVRVTLMLRLMPCLMIVAFA